MNLVLTLVLLSGALPDGSPNSVFDLERNLKQKVRTLEPQGATLALSDALGDLAAFYFNQHDYPRAENLSRRALAVEEVSPDSRRGEIARWLNNIATALLAQGKNREAGPFSERSMAIYRELPMTSDTGFALNTAGILDLRARRYSEAAKHFEQAVSLLHASRFAQAKGLGNLGSAYRGLGRDQDALAAYQEALSRLDPTELAYGVILCDYSKALAESGRKSESAEARKRARAILTRLPSPSAYTVDLSELKMR